MVAFRSSAWRHVRTGLSSVHTVPLRMWRTSKEVIQDRQGCGACAGKAIHVPIRTSGACSPLPRRRMVEARCRCRTGTASASVAPRAARYVGRGSGAPADEGEHDQGVREQRTETPRPARSGETDPTTCRGPSETEIDPRPVGERARDATGDRPLATQAPSLWFVASNQRVTPA